MKAIFRFSVILLGFFVFPVSCKKDEEVKTTNVGYSYAGAEVGRWIIYDVDSTDYNLGKAGVIQNFKFQIKEVIESEYLDAEGRPALRIERYKRLYNDTVPYDSIPWVLKDVWSANITNTTFERVEENIRFIKLAFPVKQGKRWNGNAKNTEDEWDYEYMDTDQRRSFGNLSFDSTLWVQQKLDSSLVHKIDSLEIYAKNIGMIYKKAIGVNSQNMNLSLPIMSRITTGIVCYYTINSYGKN